MRRILILVVAVAVIVKVAESDAKRSPPSPTPQAPVTVAKVAAPPPIAPVLVVQEDEDETVVEESVEEEEADDGGIDLDVAFERARVATTGALQGVIRESRTGETVAGVTVVASSRVLRGEQVAITDENGWYRITDLPSGTYHVTFYYADHSYEYSRIEIAAGQTVPFYQSVDWSIDNVWIDLGSTSTGITVDQNYIKNIPVPGRTFESALGEIQDVQITFTGKESTNNVYVVDDIDVTVE